MHISEILAADAETLSAEIGKLANRAQMVKKTVGPLWFGVAGLIGLSTVAGLYYASPDIASSIDHIDLPRSVLMKLSDIVAQTNASGAGQGRGFEAAVNIVSQMTNGPLVKIMAMTTFLMGVAMGVVKHAFGPVITGVGMSLMLSVGPSVLEKIAMQEVGGKTGQVAITKDVSDRSRMQAALEEKNWPEVLRLTNLVGSANERAYVGAQVALKMNQRDQAKQQTESLDVKGDVFDPKVVYVLEKASFGKIQSAAAKKYEKQAYIEWSSRRQTVSSLFSSGVLALVIAALMTWLSLTLNARVNRVTGMLATFDTESAEKLC